MAVSRLLGFLLAMFVLIGSAQASIVPIEPNTLVSDSVASFEHIPPGLKNWVMKPPIGVQFAERFAGQNLINSGDFDVLSGTPNGPLTLLAGAAGQNLGVWRYPGATNTLSGIGWKGHTVYAGVGEGAVSVLFNIDQCEFGFEVLGSSGGTARLQFFERDGSLIDDLALASLSDEPYAFRSDTADIAGVSITNLDPAGMALDNFRFSRSSVPEPATLALWSALGVLGAIGYRRRRRAGMQAE